MADYVVQPVFGDVRLQFGKQRLQRVAVWNRLCEKLAAGLYRFLFGKPGVLALDQDSGSVPQILRCDRTYHDTLADVVVNVWQAKPLRDFALESIGIFQAFWQRPSHQGACIEKSFGFKE